MTFLCELGFRFRERRNCESTLVDRARRETSMDEPEHDKTHVARLPCSESHHAVRTLVAAHLRYVMLFWR